MTALTDTDRQRLDRARELAGLSADAVEQLGPHYVVGQAQELLTDLVTLVYRLNETR